MNITSFKQKSVLSVTGIALLVIFVVIGMSQIVSAQYTGTGNHVISLVDAQRYIQNYWSNPIAPTHKSLYYDRNIYEKILAQPNCVGIRQYFASEGAKGMTLVLVGVDASGNDLINGVIGELGQPCPPECAPSTKLY